MGRGAARQGGGIPHDGADGTAPGTARRTRVAATRSPLPGEGADSSGPGARARRAWTWPAATAPWPAPWHPAWLARRWAWRRRRWSLDLRRALAVAAASGLAGFGITALAVGPLATWSALAPEAADLPRTTVVEALPMPALAPQLRALAQQDLELTRVTTTRGSEDVDAVLARLGVDDAEAALFLRRHGAVARALSGPGLLRARVEADGRLVELGLRHPAEEAAQRDTHFSHLVLHRDEAGEWQIEDEHVPYERRLRLAAATIETSLFAAAEGAGLPDAVAAQLSDIFSADVDPQREHRRGDRFAVVYEVLAADGEPVPWNEGAGRVLAAELTTGRRVHRALWFAHPVGAEAVKGAAAAPRTPEGGYYRMDGRSLRRAFLNSPLSVTSVSSGFAARPDPRLPGGRLHLGVDYAAPTGTRVRAVGDGVVESAGWMNGYGQTVMLDHGQGRVTLYAHLSRIDVSPGERVAQGQALGAVGATGWATGPHLHFEFRVHGVHRDPKAAVHGNVGRALPAHARAPFAEQRAQALARLAKASSLAADDGVTSTTVLAAAGRR